MKIAFPLGGTDLGRSGIGRYVREVLPRLARRLTSRDSLCVMGTPKELAAYESTLSGCELHSLAPSLDSAPLSALWYLWSAGERARRLGAEVLLLPAANRRVAWRSPLPTVSVVHDLAQQRVAEKYSASRMSYARYLMPRALSRSTCLVSVSETTQRDLRALVGPSHRLRVAYNGVDAARFRASGDEKKRVRESLGLREPYLLYTARLEHPGKNHLRLLRAFAQSSLAPSHTLVFAGMDWGARAMIVAEIERLRLTHRVRLLDFVDDALLPGLTAGAALVFMVGLYEGFGLPALEALASGRPVVASMTGALPEVVGPLGVLCDPYQESSISEAMTRAIHEESIRQRAASEGPKWAERFDWEETARGLYDACQEAIQ